jgi:hypothetical protein
LIILTDINAENEELRQEVGLLHNTNVVVGSDHFLPVLNEISEINEQLKADLEVLTVQCDLQQGILDYQSASLKEYGKVGAC